MCYKFLPIISFYATILLNPNVSAQPVNVSGAGYNETITSLCFLDSILFLGTRDGIYRSFDGGLTLEHVFNQREVQSLAEINDTIFALAGSPRDLEPGYVYCSADKGLSWIKCFNDTIVYPLKIEATKDYIFVLGTYKLSKFSHNGERKNIPFINLGGIAMEVLNNIIYLSIDLYGYDAHVFKLNDHDDHWESCSNGLPHEPVISFESGDNILIGKSHHGFISLLKSNGTSWEQLALPPTIQATCMAIGSFNEIYVGTQSNGIISSADSGKSWNYKNDGLTVGYIDGISVNNNFVFANTSGNTFFFSKNFGNEWKITSCHTNRFAQTLTFKDGILFVKTPNCIFRSLNDGESWEPAMLGLPGYYYPPEEFYWIKDITSDSTGFFALVPGPANNETTFYISTDNGQNWNLTSNIDRNRKIIKKTKNTLLAAGNAYGIDYSTDNGRTWIQLMDSIISKLNIDRIFEAYGFLFAVSNWPLGRLFRSYDQGITWEEVGFPLAYILWDIIGINEYLFAATSNNIWKSNDLGKNWEPASTGSPGRNIMDLIVKGDTLIAATDSGIGLSTDFGAHWYKLDIDLPANSFIEALAANDKYLFIGLNVFDTIPCSIWRLPVSELIVSVDDRNNLEYPEKLKLGQNYPNPFNPSTTIIYEIASAGLVSIKIYDILGREIETLVNEKKTPGRYKAEFDGSKLASGIYFYRITATDFSETKKMIMIK
ncbi:MAG: T9SS type A sorting domain-containing protein [Ignavibacteria bacterium]